VRGDFPVKVLMPYNPRPDWTKSVSRGAAAGRPQGSEYIDVLVRRAVTGFRSEVRRGGKFALMKCNWARITLTRHLTSRSVTPLDSQLHWRASPRRVVRDIIGRNDALVSRSKRAGEV
jgi:oligopeptide transport system substrate-binding protein